MSKPTKIRWYKPRTSPKESNLEEWCRNYAHERGWISRKMNGLGFRSWPDRFFLPPKKSHAAFKRFWAEFKRLRVKSTPDQKRLQKDLIMRGEAVYVIDTKNGFIRVFDIHNP